MTKKLYAGYVHDGYEYAAWAESGNHLAHLTGLSRLLITQAIGGFVDQNKNKALKALCPDKTKVYKRRLIDGAEWEAI